MHGLTAMLLGALLGLFGLALEPPKPPPPPQTAVPDHAAEIRACEATCNQSDDETDRVTCRLNCKQATEGQDDVHIIRWTKEKYLGGTVPGQDAPPPPKTTVTTVTPNGTTTEMKTDAVQTDAVQTDAVPKVVQPPTLPAAMQRSPRQKYYYGLVDCQDRCNATPDASGRARCKLRCLRLQPGPPPATSASPTTKAAPR